MTVYSLLWTFFFYSFTGWCCEVIFAAFKTGHFVNRGFLFGPVCPIYGVGVCAVVLLITPIQSNLPLVYLISAAVTTAVEFLVGWLSEKILHTRLWDYSNMPLNLGGYVCLLFSLIWGAACLLIIYFLQPAVLHLFGLIPFWLGLCLLAVFSGTILTDLILTGIEALKIPKKLRAMQELERSLCKLSDSIGEGLSDRALVIREKEAEKLPQQQARLAELRQSGAQRLQALQDQRDALLRKYKDLSAPSNQVHERLVRAFPHLNMQRADRSSRFHELTRRLQERIESLKK